MPTNNPKLLNLEFSISFFEFENSQRLSSELKIIICGRVQWILGYFGKTELYLILGGLRAVLDIKTEVHDISLLDDVILPFYSHFTGFPYLLFTP